MAFASVRTRGRRRILQRPGAGGRTAAAAPVRRIPSADAVGWTRRGLRDLGEQLLELLTLCLRQDREDLERQTTPPALERRSPVGDHLGGRRNVLIRGGRVPELDLESVSGLTEGTGEGPELALHVAPGQLADLLPLVAAQVQIMKRPPRHADGRVRRTARTAGTPERPRPPRGRRALRPRREGDDCEHR